MKRKILLAACLFSFALLESGAEGGVDFSGIGECLWGAAAPWTEENSRGHYTLGNTSFNGKLNAWYGETSFLADALVNYNALTGDLDFSLGEVYLDYTSSFWGLRVGRQKIVWGKADGIDVTNIICLSDLSDLSSVTSEDSKLPVDALQFSLTGQSVTFDVFWIPFFNSSALPLKEGNVLRPFFIPSSVEYTVEASGTTFTLPLEVTAFTQPDAVLWNGEYGAKFSGYFSFCDLSLYAFYGWENLPLLDYTLNIPNDISVSGEYERLLMFGADAALPLGESVLRMEGAFFPQRHFQKSAEKIIKEKSESTESISLSESHNELSYLAGIDWMHEGWTLTAQYFMDYVWDSMENLSREKNFEHGLTLNVSKSLLSETLELSFTGLLNFNDMDSFIYPQAEYALSDQIKFSLGAWIFLPGSEKDGKYGALKDLSSIFVKARFSF